ncbi:hypothetical protein O4H49_12200 [Kiloniella laminariae]|uniref:Uncharacterized protein n=1 Tax=Kiloniella laminariae TaxID=454162 RepID=A0ABT4LKA9_9PROT|nr:hypothetical protein [Kiloniella laminariae]MCZ4281545.1 hypothetical protein [Kiloniella laminariae]
MNNTAKTHCNTLRNNPRNKQSHAVNKPSFKVLFHLSNETIDIVEIKRLDLPDTEEKSELFHWLLLSDKHFQRLSFVSMSVTGDRQNRCFREGLLEFTDSKGRFTPVPGCGRRTGAEELAVHQLEKPSAKLGQRIKNYLSGIQA